MNEICEIDSKDGDYQDTIGKINLYRYQKIIGGLTLKEIENEDYDWIQFVLYNYALEQEAKSKKINEK